MKTGFAVIYRWRIRSGMEEQFRGAWEIVTKSLMEQREALGSRLHHAQDDTWIAYAQWPTKQTWERSRELGSLDQAATAAMREAIEESFEPVLMRPVCDHLVGNDSAEGRE